MLKFILFFVFVNQNQYNQHVYYLHQYLNLFDHFEPLYYLQDLLNSNLSPLLLILIVVILFL